MAESIKEVIARIKAQQENYQASEEPVKKSKHKEDEEEDEDFDDEFEEEEEKKVEQKKVVVPQKQEVRQEARQEVKQEAVSQQSENLTDDANRILMEIEMLQNTGRFRVELLHKLHDLNSALVIIAQTLVNMNGKGKN